ncbi:MAG: DUF1365 domain-containing protein [Alphaproteobacteria bacterium]|nr:DUF1365 domain-containing protein [Alphaproteobacteria bacterium]
MPESCLYAGEVMHKRLAPLRHRFVYRVFSMLLDIDELPALDRRLRLFAYNRRGVFSFHDSDHGARDGGALRPWVEAQLARQGIALPGGRILLHGFPRVLGFGFNPLSIFWCYDAGGALRAILYEVKNTFGEQHVYLVPIATPPAPGEPLRHARDKIFYVSPFIGMAAHYAFKVREPEARLAIAISETGPDGAILVATHTGVRRPLDDAQLLRAFVAYPLLTLKVVAGIHWEALKLWLKGASFHRRPPPPREEVTA